MPVLSRNIRETTTHITDVVTQQVANRILKMIGAYDFYAKTGSIAIRQDYRTANKNLDKYHRPYLDKDMCDIEVDSNFDPISPKWQSSTFANVFHLPVYKKHIEEEKPIFVDPIVDVVLSDKRVPWSAAITFNLYTKDRTIAYLFYDNIKSMYGQSGTMDGNISIAYDYPVDPEVQQVIKTIYELRNVVKGKGLSYDDYLRVGSGNKITKTVSPMTGIEELAVSYSQLDGFGQGDASDVRPEAQMTGDVVGNYVVRFSYAFQFMKPALHMLYFPPSIENQLVPADVLPYHFDPEERLFAAVSNNAIEGWWENKRFYEQPLRTPFYDDWTIPPTHPLGKASNYSPLAYLHVLIDENDEGLTSFNLTDVFDTLEHPLSEFSIRVLKRQGYKYSITGLGIIKLMVFSNNSPLADNRITLDQDLNFSFKAFDKIKQYHLVMVSAADLSIIDPDLLDEFADDLKELPYRNPSNGYNSPLRIFDAKLRVDNSNGN